MCFKLKSLAGAGALSAGILLSGFAAAQDVSPRPSRSTESFGTWNVECTRIEVPKKDADAKKAADKNNDKDAKSEDKKAEFRNICEAVQTYTNKKTGNEVARLAFAINKDKGNKLIGGLRTLVDASFAKKPAVLDDNNEIFTGAFSRCSGTYCYVSFEVSRPQLKKLTDAKKPMLQYPIANGRMIRIGISNTGLSDAIAALGSK